MSSTHNMISALIAMDDQHRDLCIAAGYARPVTCRALLSEMVDDHGNNGRLSDRPLQLALQAAEALCEEGYVEAEPGDRRQHYQQFESDLREILVELPDRPEIPWHSQAHEFVAQ